MKTAGGWGGGAAGKSERDKRVQLADRVEQLPGQSLCSTDLRVTRLYDPISLLFFLLQIDTNMSVFLLLALRLFLKCSKDIFSYLCVDLCYFNKPNQVFWIIGPYERLVPVGARRAVAVPPARRHVPGPCLTSPPLLPSGLP